MSHDSNFSMSVGKKVFYMVVILVAIPLIYFFLARGMRFFRVPSNSMEPTILVSDYILTLEEDTYRRGDIVVLKDPTLEGGYLVKRIVGLGGDRIAVRGGAVYLNGKYASEPYRLEPIDYIMAEYVVPEDEVFLLGDNSNWSVDSHDWAAGLEEQHVPERSGVPKSAIIGKVRYIYLPLKRGQQMHAYPLRNVDGA